VRAATCLLASLQAQVQHLSRSGLVLPERYPTFTLLRQAVGSVRLGHEALSKLVPEVRNGADASGVLGCAAAPGHTVPQARTTCSNTLAGVCGHHGLGVHLPARQAGRLPRRGVRALPHSQHKHAGARVGAPGDVQQRRGHPQQRGQVARQAWLLLPVCAGLRRCGRVCRWGVVQGGVGARAGGLDHVPSGDALWAVVLHPQLLLKTPAATPATQTS
jgi:hypothetical protein